ncbi:diguanylate cyclase [uncultured Sphaerochaeta sp.]|uniref:sensor domain-containing diguanylate cyclase n=1 Tax=uncultured Sphaerochaeta sp. TaxID=886478 RepID=UPI002AA7AA5A|nr:diguanylate cyclase [uncultured Sphaerochaeta sp.]
MKAKAKLQWNLKAFMLASLLTLLLLLTTYGLYTAWESQYIEERKLRAQTELLNLRKNLFLLLGNQEMFTTLYGLRLEESLQKGIIPGLEDLHSYLTVLEKDKQSFSFATLAMDGLIIDQYPEEGGRQVGFDLKTLPMYRQHIEHLMRQATVSIDGPLYLDDGKPYLVFRYPLLVENKQAWGLLSLYFEMESFLLGAGLEDLSGQYRYHFSFSHLGGDDTYTWGEPILDDCDPVSMILSYSLLTWKMEIAPADSWYSGELVLVLYAILGSLVSLGAGVLSYLRQVRLETFMHRSYTDSLTGLLNKREFLVQLHEELRGGRPFALALLDIDNFKLLNDTHGHLSGDKALLRLVSTLKERLRRDDLVGRFGGDEFIIILRGCTQKETCLRIYEYISHVSVPLDGDSIEFAISMGVAFSPKDGSTSEALLEAADKRLYQAKREGKGRIRCTE